MPHEIANMLSLLALKKSHRSSKKNVKKTLDTRTEVAIEGSLIDPLNLQMVYFQYVPYVSM